MSALKHALARLGNAVGNLEQSLNDLEQNMAGQQRDMFSAPVHPGAKKKNGSANGADIDVAILAKRLDQAIGKVEGILKEG